MHLTDSIRVEFTVGEAFELLVPALLSQLRIAARLRVAGVIEEPLGEVASSPYIAVCELAISRLGLLLSGKYPAQLGDVMVLEANTMFKLVQDAVTNVIAML